MSDAASGADAANSNFTMSSLYAGADAAGTALNKAGDMLSEKGVSEDPAKLLKAQLEMNKATAAFTAQTSITSTVGNLAKEMGRNLNIH